MSPNGFRLELGLIPIFTPRGGFCLLALSLFPVLGLFGGISPTHSLIVLSVFTLLFLFGVVLDRSNAKRQLAATVIEVNLPAQVRSGCAENITFYGSVPIGFLGCEMIIRPHPISGTKAKHQRYPIRFNPDGSFSFVHRLTPLSRGPHPVQALTLRLSLAPHLWQWQGRGKLNSAGVMLALPNQDSADTSSQVAILRSSIGEKRFIFDRGQGREFHSLRRYVPGDEPKTVDWKRSSRGRGLFVKNYRPETHQVVQIALDCGRRMLSLSDERQQIEHAADATLSLTKECIRNEDDVGILAFAHKTILSLPAKKGRDQLGRVATLLAQIVPSSLESDYDLITSWARQSRRRSLIVVITSFSNPAGAEKIVQAMLAAGSKHLLAIAAIADPELDRMIVASAQNLNDAYIVAAANEQRELIKQKLTALQRRGIVTIYCPARFIAQQIVETYLRLKQNGRL